MIYVYICTWQSPFCFLAQFCLCLLDNMELQMELHVKLLMQHRHDLYSTSAAQMELHVVCRYVATHGAPHGDVDGAPYETPCRGQFGLTGRDRYTQIYSYA